MKYVLMGLIRLYQWTISPALGPVCRFYPSCSHYGYQAIRTHGSIYGSYLTIRRLLRCNPWNPGGIDHVPPKSERTWWHLSRPHRRDLSDTPTDPQGV